MAVLEKIKFVALTLLVCTLAIPLHAIASISSREIETKLRDAKILPSGEKLATVVNGEEVIVYKFMAAASSDFAKDCKIDAILISKTVVNADASIKRVRVRFIDRSDHTNYSEVVVGIAALKGFSTGVTSQEDMLGSLEVNPGREVNPPPPFGSGTASGGIDNAASKVEVAEGPLRSERAALLTEIHSLELHKVNISAYKGEFSRLEELAKKGDKEATRDLLDRLNQSVSDQLRAITNRSKKVPSVAQSAGSAAATPSPDSVPPAATEPTEQMDTKSKMALLMERVMGQEKDILYTMGKAHYGDLAAAPGDFESERSLISRVIIYKRDYKGENVSGCIPGFKALNALAQNHRKEQALKSINDFYVYLHISADLVKEWKAYGDPVKAWQGVNMQKYYGTYVPPPLGGRSYGHR